MLVAISLASFINSPLSYTCSNLQLKLSLPVLEATELLIRFKLIITWLRTHFFKVMCYKNISLYISSYIVCILFYIKLLFIAWFYFYVVICLSNNEEELIPCT